VALDIGDRAEGERRWREAGRPLVPSLVGRVALVAANDFPVPRDDAGKDFRASEVNTDRVLGAHVQRVP